MYHRIVRRRLRSSFDAINRGDYAAIVRQFGHGAEHWFSGSHTLSGRRTSALDIQAWYDRLAAVFPDLHFDITKLVVGGWPWDTVAMIEWVDFVSDESGRRYSNQGVHVIRLRWGKVVELHVYCDTQLLASICETLGSQGRSAAVAEPVGASEPFAEAAARGQRRGLPAPRNGDAASPSHVN
ncbi:nuclear transport factor 2 family protein [Motilibacter deserti]|uniref:SnoaL-like domain-containing protein n=1 Tax=Motilibacter deserti TaxID=2714956 RepID=A0ABX0H2W9_9ACTN|nr:nuclear transport factor 2 family protein [Motilibacter deserti]NHC15753.1 SnoaL-like domain-containing protein [Motilibacter deserti]